MSWDPSVVTTANPGVIYGFSWSPCNKFIAISLEGDHRGRVQILDAVTLKRLKIFTSPGHSVELLAFSPESRLLTVLGSKSKPEPLISWDLQTGVQISKIPTEWIPAYGHCPPITYSECGTMFGILFEHSGASTITIYDILSSTPIYHHPIKGPIPDMIWTQEGCLRFAILVPGFLTIWEVGFASKHPPTEVNSLPIPNNVDSTRQHLFLPTLSRLAFIHERTVLVWDGQQSKLLLNSMDVQGAYKFTFSSDGHFLACGTFSDETYLWKESPTGYILYRKILSNTKTFHEPLLSPNGQFIIVFADASLQLWPIIDSTSSHSSTPTQVLGRIRNFTLGFPQEGPLAVTAQLFDNVATVLNLKSGTIQLTIDTGMEICGLGMTGSTVAIIGHGKIIAWKLPVGDHIPNARANTRNSVWVKNLGYSSPLNLLWTTMFGYSAPLKLHWTHLASISPNFNYTAVMGKTAEGDMYLIIYDVSTGEHIADTLLQKTPQLIWFTPDEHEVWCAQSRGLMGWSVTKDTESNITKLEGLDPASGPSGGFPWVSHHGHQVTGDGWMLSSSGKRLLWFPPHRRPYERDRMWNGQFLASLLPELPEVGILEIPEE